MPDKNIAGRSAERILGRSVRPVLTLRGRIHTTAQDTRKRDPLRDLVLAF